MAISRASPVSTKPEQGSPSARRRNRQLQEFPHPLLPPTREMRSEGCSNTAVRGVGSARESIPGLTNGSRLKPTAIRKPRAQPRRGFVVLARGFNPGWARKPHPFA